MRFEIWRSRRRAKVLSRHVGPNTLYVSAHTRGGVEVGRYRAGKRIA